MITAFYTKIDAALASVSAQKYYTVVPDMAVYPHIYIIVISETYDQHKSTTSPATHLKTINVQIEARATSVLDCETLKTNVLNALYSYFESVQISPIKGPIYDSEESVFRSILDLKIHQ
jgi:hypothetical protein